RLVEALLAGRLVVHDPGREGDDVLDGQAGVADALAEVLEVAAVLDVLVQLTGPRLDGVVAGPGGQLNLLDDVQLLAADGAGVEAVEEGAVVLGLRLGRGGGEGAGHAGAGRRRGAEPLAPRQSLVHGPSPCAAVDADVIAGRPGRRHKNHRACR